MISSDWRYDLIIHVLTGKATLPVFLLSYVFISWRYGVIKNK